MTNATNANTVATTISNLGEIALVNLDVHIWSGQSRLVKEDFEIGAGGRLPPEKVAQLGNKKICSPGALKVFKTLKERARRHLQEVGLPMAGCYAVPLDKLDNALTALDAIMGQFEGHRQQFLQDYDAQVAQWIAENPEDAETIRRGAKTREDVKDRLSATYQVFQVAPVKGAETGLEAAAESLPKQLVAEINKEFSAFYSGRLKKNPASLDRRTLAIFEKFLKKVGGLTFLDSRFDALEGLLADSVDVYKRSSGHLVGSDLQEIRGNVLILAGDRIHDFLDGQTQPQAGDDDDTTEASSGELSVDAFSALEKIAAAPATDDAVASSDVNTETEADAVTESDTETSHEVDDVDDVFSELEKMLADEADEAPEEEEDVAQAVSSFDPDADTSDAEVESEEAEEETEEDFFF